MLGSELVHRDLAESSSVRFARLCVSLPFDPIYSYPTALHSSQQRDETTGWRVVTAYVIPSIWELENLSSQYVLLFFFFICQA